MRVIKYTHGNTRYLCARSPGEVHYFKSERALTPNFLTKKDREISPRNSHHLATLFLTQSPHLWEDYRLLRQAT